ncbi:MAG: 50S ribosomal protein L6 [Herpetosiphon sp.]
MSRIGRKIIQVPDGVMVTVANGNFVTVKGPRATLVQQLSPEMNLRQEDGTITVERPSDEKQHRALHGLTRSLLANMVIGVSQGFAKTLDINGVGYRAQKAGRDLNLALGFSHPVSVKAPEGIEFVTPTQTQVIVTGADKQLVGEVAANIRNLRPPEPYLGKGIKYSDERIRRKAGKSGKTGKGGKK